MSAPTDRSVFTYEHYEPGKSYGTRPFTFDDAVLAKWHKVYPGDGGYRTMPGGILAMIVLDAVLFDGLLTITDTASFQRILVAGLGSGKAFGFGLLSIAPARAAGG